MEFVITDFLGEAFGLSVFHGDGLRGRKDLGDLWDCTRLAPWVLQGETPGCTLRKPLSSMLLLRTRARPPSRQSAGLLCAGVSLRELRCLVVVPYASVSKLLLLRVSSEYSRLWKVLEKSSSFCFLKHFGKEKNKI